MRSSRNLVPGLYKDAKLGQGRDAVKALLQDNIDLMEELETKIMETVKAIE